LSADEAAGLQPAGTDEPGPSPDEIGAPVPTPGDCAAVEAVCLSGAGFAGNGPRGLHFLTKFTYTPVTRPGRRRRSTPGSELSK